MMATEDNTDLTKYSYEDLERATRSFAPYNKLGEGGFGAVFKGKVCLRDGAEAIVAVKRLSPASRQGEREWLQELFILGEKRHVNLVRLLGYSNDYEDKLLLVYEFMPLGSLETHLFRRDRTVLSWSVRMKVALGSARGLAYLHETIPTIIHRDLKASNILLDQDFTPKLADFGLAKYGPQEGETHISTMVMGTQGYADVAYCMTGHLRLESDVYSFGVVLLELLTGLRAYDRSRRELLLVDWSRPYLANRMRLFDLVDVRLQGRYDPGGAQRLCELINSCLHDDIHRRPKMPEVVAILEGLQIPTQTSRAGVLASGNGQPLSPRIQPISPRDHEARTPPSPNNQAWSPHKRWHGL